MLRRFKINIIFRILILSMLLAGIILSIIKGLYLTAGFLLLMVVFLILNIIRYVEQTNRDVANFVAGIKFDDFTTSSSAHHKGKSFGEMYDVFNLVNQKFRDIRAEKEANHQFLQTMVELVDIGLICFDLEGEVMLMNKAFQRMFRKSYMVNIRAMEKIQEDLPELMRSIQVGERKLIRINIQQQPLQLAMRAVEFKLKDTSYKLIALHNIQNELEEQELISWQKLIRILTHEIMNSVAPIVSLSSTVKGMLHNEQDKQAYLEAEEDSLQIQRAMDVIQKRGENLLNFTENYRSLTRVPPPQFEELDAKEMLEQIITLLRPEIEKAGITLALEIPPMNIQLLADRMLMEQVMINLIKNAKEALIGKEGGKIIVKLIKNGLGKVSIYVIDNGPGISEELQEQIFIPFYSTKEEGSGIGLSLSRQIMRLHNGRIDVLSEEEKGTSFVLTI